MHNDDDDRGRGVTFIGPRAFVLGFAAFCAGFVGLVYAAEQVSDSIETLPPAAGLVDTLPAASPAVPNARLTVNPAAAPAAPPAAGPGSVVPTAARPVPFTPPAVTVGGGASAATPHPAAPIRRFPSGDIGMRVLHPTAPRNIAAAPRPIPLRSSVAVAAAMPKSVRSTITTAETLRSTARAAATRPAFVLTSAGTKQPLPPRSAVRSPQPAATYSELQTPGTPAARPTATTSGSPRPAVRSARHVAAAPASSPTPVPSAAPGRTAPMLLPVPDGGVAGGAGLDPRAAGNGSLLIVPANAAPPAGAPPPRPR